ncbi:hypothetical protein EHV15_06560 [Paenibacillus oralis]|uniref:Intracellular proteinase inhibitor BsuPI domain-containing protein n=1 Tax=Paenibacillus oralis TaxID=2490856 RepID=A0A3P3TXS0_9BACL|nr:hypothetical protein [Paenibacillus oralis]RRJ62640.1 hypothetical protein EHV15_06560 [Paenibacillus oralis]
MRKICVWFMILICLAGAGCQSPDPVEQAVSKPDLQAPLEVPDEQDFFSARISLPEQVGLNETFKIKAYLKNEQDFAVELQSRPDIFHYVIQDESGERVNTVTVMVDSAVIQEFPADKEISESFAYKINEPGTYEVYGIAEFTINKNGASKDYSIETEHMQFEVSG